MFRTIKAASVTFAMCLVAASCSGPVDPVLDGTASIFQVSGSPLPGQTEGDFFFLDVRGSQDPNTDLAGFQSPPGTGLPAPGTYTIQYPNGMTNDLWSATALDGSFANSGTLHIASSSMQRVTGSFDLSVTTRSGSTERVTGRFIAVPGAPSGTISPLAQ